jgi:hypothetical protein
MQHLQTEMTLLSSFLSKLEASKYSWTPLLHFWRDRVKMVQIAGNGSQYIMYLGKLNGPEQML